MIGPAADRATRAARLVLDGKDDNVGDDGLQQPPAPSDAAALLLGAGLGLVLGVAGVLLVVRRWLR